MESTVIYDISSYFSLAHAPQTVMPPAEKAREEIVCAEQTDINLEMPVWPELNEQQ